MAFPYLVINDVLNNGKLVVLGAFSETELSFDGVYFVVFALFGFPEAMFWRLKEGVVVVGFSWLFSCGRQIVGYVWRGLVGIDYGCFCNRMSLFCCWGCDRFDTARLDSRVMA